MPKFQLVLLLHAHQPVGNFDDVLQRACETSYLPFLDLLERHPAIRVGLHYSGSLLEWIERFHPEYFDRLRALVNRGQVELVGSGFYEPILISIPPEDAIEQIHRLADYLAKHFGQRPHGLWLTERVWEPQLPSLLASAGVEYTLVDDNHFLGAGFDPRQLFGTYVSENLGASVRLIPGLKALRYLIPYRSAEEVIGFLRDAARERPDGIAAMGDDLEKFGVWPGTHKHCYLDGWLERFFTALEASQEWLALAPPGEAVTSRPPLGQAALPTASYSEMMEWSLPTSARLRFQALEREFSSREDLLVFLRGGFWRGFFTKYPEANLMHKKMLHVSTKLRNLVPRLPAKAPVRKRFAEAKTDLLRAQCNDAYWHGVFGGLYAPHLRTALWRPLVRAEAFADAAAHGRQFAESRQFDFDCDGREEVYWTSQGAAILFVPDDGGTVSALDFRPAGVTLINSITRRPEAYHSRLATAGSGQGAGVVSIHEQARSKEPGLERWLRYDRWPRHSFRVLVFSPGKTHQDYEMLRLGEDAAVAGGRFRVRDPGPVHVVLVSDGPNGGGSSVGWQVEKTFSFSSPRGGLSITCDFSLSHHEKSPVRAEVGLEMIVNLLAPDKPDRYIEASGERHALRWSGALPASELHFIDEWQKVSVSLAAPVARDYWVAPIETISESEEGFERVYQGSQILAVWPVEVPPDSVWSGRLVLTVLSRR